MFRFTFAALVTLTATQLGAESPPLEAIAQKSAVKSAPSNSIAANFDILAAHADRTGETVTFRMTLAGQAGAVIPEAAGQLAGAPVLSYVWPTTLDPADVGFEAGSGILALAATSHPDFDDTPLFDENADGERSNDGGIWHSHWVVLAPNEACGEGALAVRDIPAGEKPALPATWPGLPLLIDSPGFSPVIAGSEISVSVVVPFAGDIAGTGYDGVTAALRVHADLHAPLLCVTDVFDVASGDLSLPGRLD